MKSTVKIL